MRFAIAVRTDVGRNWAIAMYLAGGHAAEACFNADTAPHKQGGDFDSTAAIAAILSRRVSWLLFDGFIPIPALPSDFVTLLPIT